MALNELIKQIRKIGNDYPWSVPSNTVVAGLVACALLGCVALNFSYGMSNNFIHVSKCLYPDIKHPHMLIL